VCYCCKTAVATGPGGAVFAAWRHVYAGNLRDIAFTVSRDGGRSFSPPVRVSEDKWQLEGCPDDGPAMTVEPDGRVHLVWPTLVTVRNQQTIGLYYSQSEDGIRFLPRQALPTEGLAHHPQIIGTRAGGLVTAWDELNDGARRIVVGRSSAAGSVAAFRRESLSDSAGGVYPALATTEAGVLVAWTSGAGENASIKLRAVDVR
jgi:hypothetical protein